MGIQTESYQAIVTKTDDPDKAGRIMVKCAGILGDEDSDLPDWVRPVMDWGWFYVPDIGEEVEIELTTDSDIDEVRLQASVSDADVRWRNKRTWSTDAEGQTPVPDDFKSNYGKRRGFSTPAGHVFLFDDTDGKTTVYLTWSGGKDSGKKSTIALDPDGTCRLLVLDKHLVHLKENVLEVKLNEGATLVLQDKDSNATATVGDGAVSAAVAEHLETFYGTLKGWLEALTVPTGMGSSGTPLNAPAPSWESSIKSGKLTFPDG